MITYQFRGISKYLNIKFQWTSILWQNIFFLQSCIRRTQFRTKPGNFKDWAEKQTKRQTMYKLLQFGFMVDGSNTGFYNA